MESADRINEAYRFHAGWCGIDPWMGINQALIVCLLYGVWRHIKIGTDL